MTSSGSRPRFSTEDDWYAPFDATPDFDLPMYVGGATFQKLPFVGEPQALRERAADVAVVGAPMDEGDTYRPGARFGPRAIRLAHSNTGSVYALHSGLEPLAVLDAVDAGDAAIEPTWIAHNHRAVYRKVRDVVNAGTVPLVLGGRPLDLMARHHCRCRGPLAAAHRRDPLSTRTQTRATRPTRSPPMASRCAG